MRNKQIDIRNYFLRDIIKEKDMDIKYISSEENLTDIMTVETPVPPVVSISLNTL